MPSSTPTVTTKCVATHRTSFEQKAQLQHYQGNKKRKEKFD